MHPNIVGNLKVCIAYCVISPVIEYERSVNTAHSDMMTSSPSITVFRKDWQLCTHGHQLCTHGHQLCTHIHHYGTNVSHALWWQWLCMHEGRLWCKVSRCDIANAYLRKWILLPQQAHDWLMNMSSHTVLSPQSEAYLCMYNAADLMHKAIP